MFQPSKLPIGIQTFSEIIEGGYCYVDKTALACRMLEEHKYYFLSRPRRFGKSLFLDTLKSMFEGRKEWFVGLAAEKQYAWDRVWPVIRLNFAAGKKKTVHGWGELLLRQMGEIEEQQGVSCVERDPALRLRELIGKLHRHTGCKVVVLVDEYDKPILDNLENSEIALEMREFLGDFYSVLKSEDEHLRFVFLTGVSKFAKVSLFSGLNHLKDISLDPRYATICGYTQTELNTVFAAYLDGFALADIKRWYNGYHWLGEPVYNPWSLLNLFDEKRFKGYWIESGKPGFLLKLLMQQQVFAPRLAAWVTDETLLGKFDVDDISAEALLFQAGYLTIQSVDRENETWSYLLGYPNLEVEKHLNADLFVSYTGNKIMPAQLSAALHALDWAKVEALMRAQFAAIPYHYHTQNRMAHYEGWYASVFFCMLGALGLRLVAEDVTNHGRIDLSMHLPGAICVFEFKLGERGEPSDNGQALAQIRQKNYAQKYAADGRPVVLIGVTFSESERNIIGFEVAGLA